MKNSLAILLFSFLPACAAITGCNPKPENTNTKAQEPVAFRISAGGANSSCPYLTKDAKGNIVLSWVQATDSTENYLLYYAVSDNEGKTFGAPQVIPTSKGVYPHDENLSKILFKQNGDIMAVFAVNNPNQQNKYAGLVYYTQSFDNGKTWTDPRQLSESTESSIDERYFDIALLPDGNIAAVWLDSRKGMDMSPDMPMNMENHTMHMDKEGSSLYYASTNGRSGFIGEKAIAGQLCQCCRTALHVDEKDQLHVAYRGILNDSIRDMMHLVSADNGKSFSKPERISPDNWVIDGCPHTGPTMASNHNGMHYAWFTMGGGSGVYYAQQQSGTTFSPREPVSNAPSAKHPQMTSVDNGRLAIVWDDHTQQGSRVGLQLRNKEGNFISNTYLTPDSANASFPVITTTNTAGLLIAYTRRNDKSGEVWFELVDVAK